MGSDLIEHCRYGDYESGNHNGASMWLQQELKYNLVKAIDDTNDALLEIQLVDITRYHVYGNFIHALRMTDAVKYVDQDLLFKVLKQIWLTAGFEIRCSVMGLLEDLMHDPRTWELLSIQRHDSRYVTHYMGLLRRDYVSLNQGRIKCIVKNA